MGLFGKAGGAVASGAGTAAGVLLDSKEKHRFKMGFLKSRPTNLTPHEIAEITAQSKREALDNDVFVQQAERISITKHRSELNINIAIKQISKIIGEDLVFPKNKGESDKLWAELSQELKLIEENTLPFDFAVRSFMTIYQHQLGVLTAEIRTNEKIDYEIKAKEMEIEFLEKNLGTNGIFNQLLYEVEECARKADECDKIVSRHVSAEAQSKILDGAALAPFSVAFKEISKREKEATKLVHRFFKRNKSRISNFEIQAQLVSKAYTHDISMARRILADKGLSYLTLGNALTVVAVGGMIVASGGLGAWFASPALKVFGDIFTSVNYAWITTLYKPALAAGISVLSKSKMSYLFQQARSYL